MKITLLHPSRGRPKKSYENVKEWAHKSGCEIEIIVSIDNNDHKKQDYINLYGGKFTCIDLSVKSYRLIYNDNTCVVEATNHAAKIATGDILIYLSDDFKCPDNWGQIVIKEFENENRPLLLKVDDCLQKFEVPVLTIPMMNRSLYEKLGYFWHPEYKSMSVDEDLYWTARKLGAIKNAPHLKFPHEHPSNGKAPNDETYIRSAANWDQGREVFGRRKAAGFPV